MAIESRPVAVDLFCGAGGMSLGFEQAGFDVALGVDLDGYHVAAHDRNFPCGKTLGRSVADLTAEEIHTAAGTKEIDLICGGPPCQGFSHMGLRDVRDARNTLVGAFARIVAEVRPKAFVMENVPGMLSGATREVLDSALTVFETAGYRVTHPVKVLDASHFGVPQKRKRLFVLGLRNDIGGTIDYPARNSGSTPTVWDALADLPDVDSLPELFESQIANFAKDPKNEYAKRMRGELKDAGDYSHPRRWDRSRCTGCQRVRHAPNSVELYRATPNGEMVPGHKLPKLDPDGYCPTLRAGSDSSHGSYTAPRPIHPHRPRCITVREAARLHGFPDWFDFYPLKWHGYRQIGNAVCPPVARAIGASILKALGIRPARPKRVIELTDEFHLADDRPRTLKRIPQVLHFPPVIQHLFEKRFDTKNTKLKTSRFSFEDVQCAILETGSELTWVRGDTFLAEIARSRNVLKLLEPCLSRGFTIRPLKGESDIGEFVPAGHAEGIEGRKNTKAKTLRIQVGGSREQ